MVPGTDFFKNLEQIVVETVPGLAFNTSVVLDPQTNLLYNSFDPAQEREIYLENIAMILLDHLVGNCISGENQILRRKNLK